MVHVETGAGRVRTVVGYGSEARVRIRHVCGCSNLERGLMMSQMTLCDTCRASAGVGMVDTA